MSLSGWAMGVLIETSSVSELLQQGFVEEDRDGLHTCDTCLFCFVEFLQRVRGLGMVKVDWSGGRFRKCVAKDSLTWTGRKACKEHYMEKRQ